ncbi:hypothetical protein B7982_10655 [Fibrobacter sp. UWB2]|uniref:glycosyltransferase n=1 Tax=Fibrobacter sp. UWB2 TaxID=1964358 RepID=UPI000B5284E1|nr:glycosyltransferase [Fibrobacter sp. UWB2]OWV21565.1 hypothetical protein B7982_10655 [Fibrobacter sp. UWB2]
MNILYMMRYWPVYGGGETITVTLANEFIRRGYKVFASYLYYKTINPMPYQLNESIGTIEISSYDVNDSISLKLYHDFLKEHNIDLIINQWGDTSFARKAIGNLPVKLIRCWHQEVIPKFDDRHSKIKNFFNDHIHPIYAWREKRNYLRMHKEEINISDEYIFLANSFLNDFKHLSHNYKVHKLGAISNPLTYTDFFDMANYEKKEKMVLFVGRMLEHHKRMSYMLKIWKEICVDSEFSDWKLVMVGDGPDFSKTKEMAQKMGLTNIVMNGKFENPRPYYNKASVFLMTSASEGFGMTLLESQQYACVPMAMDTYGSLHEIIKDGYNGLIIKDNDFEAYVNQLKELMRNKKWRRSLAGNGLESSREFSLPKIADKWEELFRSLVK